MFDTKSDFALNKFDQDAIVCRSVTGVHIRLTREDFASEEEFLRWKAWSDGDYYDTEKDGRGFYDNSLPLAPRVDKLGAIPSGTSLLPWMLPRPARSRPGGPPP
ncbi:hypothetical protein D1159_10205 [Pseudoflavonifractor sp. 524-17]|uniref:hypothetical protein n=1 Tax=Pseudoflavonifractor sp. 524-17 TaxID=2304577 RepID=UPI00137A1101|nr:hypothetical protein [Pseudoflavonifractor sp. 524-17]NCE64948.1 hypothetical protein [Pseudoflavonifractor sp. 524-17]